MAATHDQQQPFIYQSLPRAEVYLAPPSAPAAAASAPTTTIAAVAPPVAPATPSSPCGGGTLVSWLFSRAPCSLSAAEERGLKPKDTFKECDECPAMVAVPAGNFIMGAPKKVAMDNRGPQHSVTIARQFAVGEFPITVDQFAAFVAETGYDTGSKCRAIECVRPIRHLWQCRPVDGGLS